jgi:hypothetical protein
MRIGDISALIRTSINLDLTLLFFVELIRKGGAMIDSLLFAFAHFSLAATLFFLVNKVGEHAEEFGYTTSNLFEEVTEDAALNLFLKVLAPSVFIVILSATAVVVGQPEWRVGIFWVAIWYYVGRACFLILWGRFRLVRWGRFLTLAALGTGCALLAYEHLILPNRSLLPNVEQIGNELWLAILAFLYAVANKIPMKSGPKARQTNAFVGMRYQSAVERYGTIIVKVTGADSLLNLIAYSVLIYEDYSRPLPVRVLERLFWSRDRTTGVMQVRSTRALNDQESVALGTKILVEAWVQHANEQWKSQQVRSTILAYNRDENYATQVLAVMEILAKRIDRRFEQVYDAIWNYRENPEDEAPGDAQG